MSQLATISSKMRRRRRKPSRVFRKNHSVREPRSAVITATKVFNKRLVSFEQKIKQVLFPVLSETIRQDAIPRSVRDRLSILDLEFAQIFNEESLNRDMDIIGHKVQIKNKKELLRLLGISIRADIGMGAALDQFRAANVSKIRSLAGRELIEITQLLETAEAEGLRVETLQRRIEERFQVTKSKASLLARDQILTLNGQITKTRQTNAGIIGYIWTTSDDERVRDIHADLDGIEQRWDVPPIISKDGRTGHPGDDYQCRCTAYPIVPEFLELGIAA